MSALPGFRAFGLIGGRAYMDLSITSVLYPRALLGTRSRLERLAGPADAAALATGGDLASLGPLVGLAQVGRVGPLPCRRAGQEPAHDHQPHPVPPARSGSAADRTATTRRRRQRLTGAIGSTEPEDTRDGGTEGRRAGGPEGRRAGGPEGRRAGGPEGRRTTVIRRPRRDGAHPRPETQKGIW